MCYSSLMITTASQRSTNSRIGRSKENLDSVNDLGEYTFYCCKNSTCCVCGGGGGRGGISKWSSPDITMTNVHDHCCDISFWKLPASLCAVNRCKWTVQWHFVVHRKRTRVWKVSEVDSGNSSNAIEHHQDPIRWELPCSSHFCWVDWVQQPTEIKVQEEINFIFMCWYFEVSFAETFWQSAVPLLAEIWTECA